MSPTSTLLTQAIAKVKACYHDDHHTEQWDTEIRIIICDIQFNFVLPPQRHVLFSFSSFKYQTKLSDNCNTITLLKIHLKIL